MRPIPSPLPQLGLKFQIPPRPAVTHTAAAAAAAPVEGGGGEGAAGEQPPAADAAEQPPQHVIDMSLYSEESLTRHDKDTYPIVIRLETVTDKGLKDGHTLQVGGESGALASHNFSILVS